MNQQTVKSFFYLETEWQEVCIQVTANFYPGNETHIDEHGRPTEIGPDDEWDILSLKVDGRDVELEKVAHLFISYNIKTKEWENMTPDQLRSRCISELTENIDHDLYSEELPF